MTPKSDGEIEAVLKVTVMDTNSPDTLSFLARNSGGAPAPVILQLLEYSEYLCIRPTVGYLEFRYTI